MRAEASTWRLISATDDASSSLAAATECTLEDASLEAPAARWLTFCTVSAVLLRVPAEPSSWLAAVETSVMISPTSRLELIGKAVHVGLALLHLPRLERDLLLAQAIGFDHGVAEHGNRARHLADLVGPVGIGDRRCEFAGARARPCALSGRSAASPRCG